MRKRLILFSLINWIGYIMLACVGICGIYFGVVKEQYAYLIAGVVGLPACIKLLDIFGGYAVVDKDNVKTKRRLHQKYSIVKREGIKCLYVCYNKSIDHSKYGWVMTVRANSSKGPILGVGSNIIRGLTKILNVPVILIDIDITYLFAARTLLQKGQLTRVKAERLKEKLHIPQKLFDKWYVEPKQ